MHNQINLETLKKSHDNMEDLNDFSEDFGDLIDISKVQIF
jgi:hypothetical protein